MYKISLRVDDLNVEFEVKNSTKILFVLFTVVAPVPRALLGRGERKKREGLSWQASG